MNDSDIIGNSIDRIESRLTEAFDVEELAQQAFFRKPTTSGCFAPWWESR